jgi:Domain of unknown function (DUF4384)
MRLCCLIWIAALVGGGISAQTRMEIVVEKKRGDAAERMDPGHIFATGDLVRFRFSADLRGYLYVMSYNTSGKYVLLFPKEETGAGNVVEQSKEYTIPATSGGWFRIEGPPGQDIVYWMVAPADLAASRPPRSPAIPPAPAPRGALPAGVTPRCDDAIFRAQGDCVDPTAGVKPDSDRLVVDRSGDRSVISSTGPLGSPVIYEFRVAHK